MSEDTEKYTDTTAEENNRFVSTTETSLSSHDETKTVEEPKVPYTKEDTGFFSDQQHVVTQDNVSNCYGQTATCAMKTTQNISESSLEANDIPSAAKNISSQPGKKLSFFATHPALVIPSTIPPSFSSRLFTFLSFFGLLFLTAMIVLQTAFSLDARSLWYSDEVRHAEAFVQFLHSNKWFVLDMNGELYPDKPTGYFILLRWLHTFITVWLPSKAEGPFLFFASTAISGVIFLWSSHLLGKFVGRGDRRTLLASGIILLTFGFTVGLLHYCRMDLLFAACIILSHICFYHACIRPRAMIFSALAFLFAVCACLIKGPLGFLLPFTTALVFLAWNKNPLRIFKKDFFFGFVIALLLLSAWAAGMYVEGGGYDFIYKEVFQKQMVERAVNAFHHKEPWHYYLVRVPLAFLPWTLLLFFLPVEKFSFRVVNETYKESLTPAQEGITFLWCMALTCLVVLSSLSSKILVYYLPAFPAVSFLFGRFILKFESARATIFRYVLAVFLFCGGIGVIIGAFMLFGLLPVPELPNIPTWQLPQNAAFFLVAALLIIAACILLFGLRSPRAEGLLLVMAFLVTGLGYPLASKVAPTFDEVLSPKAQALVLRQYVDQGYKTMAYKVYGGVYAYYAGHSIPVIKSLETVQNQIAEFPEQGIALVTRKKTYAEWQEKPSCMEIVQEQWIETRQYVVAICSPSYSEQENATQTAHPTNMSSEDNITVE